MGSRRANTRVVHAVFDAWLYVKESPDGRDPTSIAVWPLLKVDGPRCGATGRLRRRVCADYFVVA
jgi:hypothetical protein